MAETVTFEVPADAPDRDLERVEREASVARRNAEIRRRYESLRDEHGRMDAYEQLSDAYHVSPRQVRRIVYGS
jgi:hypothetical protein